MALDAGQAWQFDYDEQGDVLYASMGEPQPALSHEVETDVLLLYVPPSQQVVGMTVVNFLKHFPRRKGIPVLAHAVVVVQELLAKYPEVLSV